MLNIKQITQDLLRRIISFVLETFLSLFFFWRMAHESSSSWAVTSHSVVSFHRFDIFTMLTSEV